MWNYWFCKEIYSGNWRSWSWIGISSKNSDLVIISWQQKGTFYSPIQAKIHNLPSILLLIQFFYLLWSFICASIATNNIQLLFPNNRITSTSFNIQIWHNDPLIFPKWISFTTFQNSFLILSEISPTNYINSLLEKGCCVGVSCLIHIAQLFYRMRYAIINEGLRGDFSQWKIYPSRN